ncbi:MAG: methylated-DNA--[protein]-cysteine S-methyltransferase [Gammaproteobacteria bacterium]|nr:methylated-DNA--[protein]-cysteine S-methyltransferase [Gammaproteobacteria bacterium]
MTRRLDKWRQGELFGETGESLSSQISHWLEKVRSEFSVFVSDEGVAEIRMLNGVEKPLAADHAKEQSTPLNRRASKEIEEYLRGTRKSFKLKTDLSSLTPFMTKVLKETEKIPYGETRSYGWVSNQIGNPKASRAVGQALHRNPVPLIIP